MNSVNTIGRLVRDPQLIKNDNGTSICSFRIAMDDVWSAEDRADFINIKVYGNQADNCDRYLRKGFFVGVQGRLYTESYTDADGVQRDNVQIIAERVQFLQWPERGDKK